MDKKERQNMELKEITPKVYQCSAFACPSIFEVDQKGKLVIVGLRVNPKELGIAERVGENEQAVMIDKEMLRKIFEK